MIRENARVKIFLWKIRTFGKEPKKEYNTRANERKSAHEILGTKKPIEEEWLSKANGRDKA